MKVYTSVEEKLGNKNRSEKKITEYTQRHKEIKI